MPHYRSPDATDGSSIPSLVTHVDAEEFQRILREGYGEKVDLAEAWNRLQDVVTLVRMLLSPIPEDPERHKSGSATESTVAATMPVDVPPSSIPRQQVLPF